MRFLLAIVRFVPLPLFLGLAAINYHLESMGAGHHGSDHGEEMAPMMAEGLMAHLTNPVLGTMWLMYLLMAFAHAGPWLSRGRISH